MVVTECDQGKKAWVSLFVSKEWEGGLLEQCLVYSCYDAGMAELCILSQISFSNQCGREMKLIGLTHS